MKNYKNHIAFFYLIFFISIKCIGLHSLAHESDDYLEDCEICEYAITSNKVPFVAAKQVLLEAPIKHSAYKQLFYQYSYRFAKNQTDSILFGRPPPVA